jgi:23S rRNA (guanosine2251-2'-O)-methyltransferase
MPGKKNKKGKGTLPAAKTITPAEKAEYEMIWGRQPVLEALKSGLSLVKINVHEGARGSIINEIIQRAGQIGVPVERIKRSKLEEETTGQSHQGVVAYTTPYAYVSVEELLQKARKRQKRPFFLMLDHIEDPHNLGSLLRTAGAAGIDGVIIPRDRACGVTPTVFKSSAGSLAYVPVARSVNLAREMDFLKEEGLWLMGADMSGERPFFKADFSLPLVLLLGSEGKGLSRLLREKCDLLLRIPMQGAVSSLNVAVAGGIIIYEVFRQRGLQK